MNGAGGTRLCHENKTEEEEGPRNEQTRAIVREEDGLLVCYY